MSDPNKSEDWEKILNRLTEEKKSKPTLSNSIIGGILSFAVLNAITTVILMMLNNSVNRAWPNIDTFTPSIGFWDAWSISGLLWFIYLIKIGVSMGFRSSR
jgi:hypothetical protein